MQREQPRSTTRLFQRGCSVILPPIDNMQFGGITIFLKLACSEWKSYKCHVQMTDNQQLWYLWLRSKKTQWNHHHSRTYCDTVDFTVRPVNRLLVFFFLSMWLRSIIGQLGNSSIISRNRPPFDLVRRQDSTMWDIVWVSPQEHRSMSVRRQVFLQAPQCPWLLQKRFRRDHCCRGRVKPGCRIMGSSTRWTLTTGANFQDSLHWFLMSVGIMTHHGG